MKIIWKIGVIIAIFSFLTCPVFAGNPQQEELDALNEADETNAMNEVEQRTTILPQTSFTVEECKAIMNYIISDTRTAKDIFKNRDIVFTTPIGSDTYSLNVTRILGCGIKTGQIRLWMIPYYIRYILEFALQIGGLVSVGGIVYGGYLYLFAGVSEDKEKGKSAIMYSVAGLILALLAWAFINIVVSVLTT